MTPEMRALRAYVLNEPPSLTLSSDAAEAAEATLEPEPEDFVLELALEPAPPQPAVVPAVPNVFTGQSRTGVHWAGAELCEKYGASPARFALACDGDDRVAAVLFRELRSLMAVPSS